MGPKPTKTHPFYSSIIHSALLHLSQTQSTSRRSSGLVASNIDSDSDDENNHSSELSNNDSSDRSDDSSDEQKEHTVSEDFVEKLIESMPAMKKGQKKKVKSTNITLKNAPSIKLPLPQENDNELQNTGKMALSIPSIFLPNNYLRNNPNYDISEVSSRLLSTWNELSDKSESATIIIVLIQSGRFASAVFSLQTTTHHPNGVMQMLAHKTSTRYTVRKGQGGSQSAHDSSKKAKSMGAQLRREGERQLRHDVVNTWKEWKELGLVERSMGVWIGVPKAMRRDYLFGGDDSLSASNTKSDALIDKNDHRVRSIPLDYGRPTLEAVEAVLECLMRCQVGELGEEDQNTEFGKDEEKEDCDTNESTKLDNNENNPLENLHEFKKQLPVAPPYTPLHEAVIAGELDRVEELLYALEQSEAQESEQSYDINAQGGPEFQTPLHVASSSTHDNAASILNILLLQGRADPCAIDSRGRPPYYLAASDKIRETFRLCRGKLGEDHCSWDAAKVGPALTVDDIDAKRLKALEKKKRQRARQKEKKAAEAAEAAKIKKEEEEKAAKLKAEEDAKRVRDGLKPKISTGNACDFCQKAVKKKSSMFQRLQYYYCSTECVKRHQRELAAAAATARMGK